MKGKLWQLSKSLGLLVVLVLLSSCGAETGEWQQHTIKTASLPADIFVQMIDGTEQLVASDTMEVREVRYDKINSSGKVLEYGSVCIMVPASATPGMYTFDGAYLHAEQIGRRIDDALRDQGLGFIHTYTSGLSGTEMAAPCGSKSLKFVVSFSYALAYSPQIDGDRVLWHYDPDYDGAQHAWFALPKGFFDETMLRAAQGEVYHPERTWAWTGGSLANFAYYNVPQGGDAVLIDPDEVKAFVDYYLPTVKSLWGVEPIYTPPTETELTLHWQSVRKISVCCKNDGFLHFRHRTYTEYVPVNKSQDVILVTGDVIAAGAVQ